MLTLNGLAGFPIYFFSAKMVQEDLSQGFFHLYKKDELYAYIFNTQWPATVALSLLALIIFLKPFFSCLAVYKTKDKESFLLTDFLAYLFYPIFSIVFVDLLSTVSTIDLLGYSLSVMGFLVYFLSCD